MLFKIRALFCALAVAHISACDRPNTKEEAALQRKSPADTLGLSAGKEDFGKWTDGLPNDLRPLAVEKLAELLPKRKESFFIKGQFPLLPNDITEFLAAKTTAKVTDCGPLTEADGLNGVTARFEMRLTPRLTRTWSSTANHWGDWEDGSPIFIVMTLKKGKWEFSYPFDYKALTAGELPPIPE